MSKKLPTSGLNNTFHLEDNELNLNYMTPQTGKGQSHASKFFFQDNHTLNKINHQYQQPKPLSLTSHLEET